MIFVATCFIAYAAVVAAISSWVMVVIGSLACVVMCTLAICAEIREAR